jgi:hypothetical protein
MWALEPWEGGQDTAKRWQHVNDIVIPASVVHVPLVQLQDGTSDVQEVHTQQLHAELDCSSLTAHRTPLTTKVSSVTECDRVQAQERTGHCLWIQLWRMPTSRQQCQAAPT